MRQILSVTHSSFSQENLASLVLAPPYCFFECYRLPLYIVQPKLAVIELLYLDEGKITSWKRICHGQVSGQDLQCYAIHPIQHRRGMLF